MRKILLGLLVVCVVGAGIYFRHHKKQPAEIAYAANRDVTLWSTVAAVRQPVATVDYGAPLEVLSRFEDHVKVRASNGAVGWIDQTNLLTPEFWETTKQLEAKTAKMPVEALGHTAVLTNLHVAPGRNAPRIRQLGKMVPVEMFAREPLDAPARAIPASDDESAGNGAPVRKEDWWLVRAQLRNKATVSGWVLGRFIALDLPEAIYDYASASDMHVAAWFDLDYVTDGSGAMKPQYLVVGTRGSEGQPCDFTMLRVYTWSKTRQRYETAYVESGVCGALPVSVKQLSPDEANFSFENRNNEITSERVYRLQQTMVRLENRPRERPAERRNIRG